MRIVAVRRQRRRNRVVRNESATNRGLSMSRSAGIGHALSWQHGGVRHQSLSDGIVWLSAPDRDDVDVVALTCRHSSIAAWTTIPVPYSRVDAVNFVDDIVPTGWANGSPTWGIRLGEGGELVGMVGLQRHRDDVGAAELGFWLAPKARGRGLMTRSVHLVCAFAFGPGGLRLDRVDWRAFVGNHASAAVVRNVGFRYEGALRGGGVQRGVRRDEWVAGRLRNDPSGPADGWPPETFAMETAG